MTINLTRSHLIQQQAELSSWNIELGRVSRVDVAAWCAVWATSTSTSASAASTSIASSSSELEHSPESPEEGPGHNDLLNIDEADVIVRDSLSSIVFSAGISSIVQIPEDFMVDGTHISDLIGCFNSDVKLLGGLVVFNHGGSHDEVTTGQTGAICSIQSSEVGVNSTVWRDAAPVGDVCVIVNI